VRGGLAVPCLQADSAKTLNVAIVPAGRRLVIETISASGGGHTIISYNPSTSPPDERTVLGVQVSVNDPNGPEYALALPLQSLGSGAPWHQWFYSGVASVRAYAGPQAGVSVLAAFPSQPVPTDSPVGSDEQLNVTVTVLGYLVPVS